LCAYLGKKVRKTGGRKQSQLVSVPVIIMLPSRLKRAWEAADTAKEQGLALGGML